MIARRQGTLVDGYIVGTNRKDRVELFAHLVVRFQKAILEFAGLGIPACR